MPRKPPPVADNLLENGHQFEFYRAVNILELISEAPNSVAADSEPEQEAVRFKSRVGTDFPASQIHKIDSALDSEDDRPTMWVDFIGLAGAHGPLPLPYTEQIVRRVRSGDRAMRDFFDIFNHRLVSLMFRVRKTHRLGFDGNIPWQSRFSRFMFSLMGMGTEGMLHRMQIEDHALLFYTGLLFPQARSIVGLESMLQDYFGVPVEGISFVGQWHRLPPDEYSTIGLGGQNQQLGSAALGTRIWDQQGKIDVKLGPLDFKEFMNFLPIGWGFIPLYELTRFYVGHELDFDIRLVLKPQEVPECRLDAKNGARLGWTSWLKTKEFEKPGQVWINPKFFLDHASAARIPLFSSLPQDELDEIMSQMTVHHYPAHTTVMRQGDLSDSMFIIKVGEVKVVNEGLDGVQTVHATLGPDDFFGEYAFLTGKPRIATVITTTDAKILELSKSELLLLMDKYPRVGQAIEAFSQRWRNTGGATTPKSTQSR